jgi:hypothetical protein
MALKVPFFGLVTTGGKPYYPTLDRDLYELMLRTNPGSAAALEPFSPSRG